MQIIEPNEENSKDNVSITIPIPFHLYLHGKRDDAEYERISVEDLQMKSGIIFSHISSLSYEKGMDGGGTSDDFAIIELLSDIGKGMMESVEEIRLAFLRGNISRDYGMPEISQPQISLGDLKGKDLALAIYQLIYGGNLPAILENRIFDGLFETAENRSQSNVQPTAAAEDEKVPDEYDFEGLYLDEVWDCNFIRPGQTLTLEVKRDKQSPVNHRVVKSNYSPSRDGHFKIDVVYLDLVEAYEPVADNLADHSLQIKVNKIAHVLRSDIINDDVKSPFYQMIVNAANEANIGIDHPELVKIVLPLIINSLEFEYGKGIVHSLGALLDALPQDTKDEIAKYEIRFESKPENSDASNDLAFHIAAVLNDPNCPVDLHDAMQDQMSQLEGDVLGETTKTVDYIRKVLDSDRAQGRHLPEVVEEKPKRQKKAA